jgi:hypothetical protein
MDEGIVVSAWLWTLVEGKHGRRNVLKVDNLVYEVKQRRIALTREWVCLKSWQLYLSDTKVFVDSVDKFATSMNGCAVKH